MPENTVDVNEKGVFAWWFAVSSVSGKIFWIAWELLSIQSGCLASLHRGAASLWEDLVDEWPHHVCPVGSRCEHEPFAHGGLLGVLPPALLEQHLSLPAFSFP